MADLSYERPRAQGIYTVTKGSSTMSRRGASRTWSSTRTPRSNSAVGASNSGTSDPCNGPGDTIVYVPDAYAACTGNYLCHAGTAHMLLQGGPEPYLGSLRRMRDALPELQIIVPGHGPMGSGPEAISWLIDYLENLRDDVARLHSAGHSLEETVQLCPSPFGRRSRPAAEQHPPRIPGAACGRSRLAI